MHQLVWTAAAHIRSWFDPLRLLDNWGSERHTKSEVKKWKRFACADYVRSALNAIIQCAQFVGAQRRVASICLAFPYFFSSFSIRAVFFVSSISFLSLHNCSTLCTCMKVTPVAHSYYMNHLNCVPHSLDASSNQKPRDAYNNRCVKLRVENKLRVL